MKKIFYLLLVVVLSSCSDMLDLEPQQSLSPDVAYKTLNDCDNAARGMYMRAQQVYGDDYILITDAFTDNLMSFSRGRGTYSEFRDWKLTSGSSYMWTRPYATIINCSLLLEKMIIPTKGAEISSFNQIKGEALALRALMHFELVRQMGKAINVASDKDLGIPYVRTTDSKNRPARQTVKQNYIDIKKELLEAYSLMNEEGVSNLKLDNTRLQKNTVAAILSRVYLAEHNYSKSVEYAGYAIEGAGSKIASAAKFADVWKDKSEEGVYWKLAVTQKENLKVGDLFNQFLNSEYKSEFIVPKSLVSLYSSSDVRKDSYFNTSEFDGYNANHVIKYIGDVKDKSVTRNKVALKIIRGAEMYLTRAEAYMRLATPNNAAALADLIIVLEQRGLYSVGAKATVDALTGEALLNEIMKQRRLELFCEWDRYHTYKRLNQDIIRLDGEGELADGTGRSNVQFVLKFTDHRFQFPILSSELDANSNIIQNPGY